MTKEYKELLLSPEEFKKYKHCEKVSYGDITVNEEEWDIMGLLKAQHLKTLNGIIDLLDIYENELGFVEISNHVPFELLVPNPPEKE